ncbi:MAG: diguanylate cyclase [Paracoccaceae bacterium]
MAGRILVVDDAVTNRIVLKAKLAAACYQPLLAGGGAGCLRLARQERPDAILLDLMLPDMAGTAVLEQLRADPVTRDIPVVVVSASEDRADRLAAFRAGADDFIAKPVDEQFLLARLRSLIAARAAVEGFSPDMALGLAEPAADFIRPGVIALVADRAEEAAALRGLLQPHLSGRMVTLAPGEALMDDSVMPDAYVIAADLGGTGGGLRLMSDLRSRAAGRHAGICILHPAGRADLAPMALDLGASDVIAAGGDPGELAARLKAVLRRKAAVDRMRASVQDGLRLAMTDSLTGLHNRRYGVSQLAAIARLADDRHQPFAVMVVDIDHFKRVNDNWGHAAGDAVLIEVARRLKSALREGDLLARFGGEEFLIAIPEMTLEPARAIAERLCAAVEELPIPLPEGGDLRITVSIGLAIGNARPRVPLHEPVNEIVNRADRALLVSKSEGRNQVTVARSAA